MSIRYTVLGFEPTNFSCESHPITTRPGLLRSSFLKRRLKLAPPSTPDFFGTSCLVLVTSCYSWKKLRLRPACSWLRWGSLNISDLMKALPGIRTVLCPMVWIMWFFAKTYGDNIIRKLTVGMYLGINYSYTPRHLL